MKTKIAVFVSRHDVYPRSWSIVAVKPAAPMPELTLGDEDVPVLHPDEDVGLASEVERLAGPGTFVHPVERKEEVRSNVLLAERSKRMRAPLDDQRHVLDRCQDVVVLRSVKSWLRAKRLGQLR